MIKISKKKKQTWSGEQFWFFWFRNINDKDDKKNNINLGKFWAGDLDIIEITINIWKRLQFHENLNLLTM